MSDTRPTPDALSQLFALHRDLARRVDDGHSALLERIDQVGDRVVGAVAATRTELHGRVNELERERVKGLEGRVGALERAMARVKGAVAVVVAIPALVGAWMQLSGWGRGQ